MQFHVMTLFPEMIAQGLANSITGRALREKLISLNCVNIRDYSDNRHGKVDDYSYGGGAGMLIQAEPVYQCYQNLLSQIPDGHKKRVIYVTPQGRPFCQEIAEELVKNDDLIFLCGHYEGVDERVLEEIVTDDISIGDYVLNGGEVAAMVLTEAVARLLEGFMGNPDSLVEESHSGAGLLEYPVFTKPREFRSLEIPEVLLGGNHAAIERWRRDRAIEKTVAVRPDLALSLDAGALSGDDRAMLAACGVAYPAAGAAERLDVRQAELEDVVAVSELAARTFPDACPENLPQEAIDEHIATQLSADVFDALISDPERHRLFVAEVWGGLVGYVLTHVGPDALPSDLVRPGRVEAGSAYLSKCYVDAAWRGSGIADVLLERAVADAATAGHRAIVLGTNRGNKAAQAFYKKHGFRKRSTRTFEVGGVTNYDVVMVRDLTA